MTPFWACFIVLNSVEQGLANHGLQVKLGSQPVVNVSPARLVHLYMVGGCPHNTMAGLTIAMEIVWLKEPKIFIWPFPRKSWLTQCAGKSRDEVGSCFTGVLILSLHWHKAGYLFCDRRMLTTEVAVRVKLCQLLGGSQNINCT